jgi:ubiquitin carboxyl-terminal hydrolase 4/11
VSSSQLPPLFNRLTNGGGLPDASVSKLSDPGKVVGPAAYLLFYRRRSEVPLGGPRFQEIFDRFNQHHSDEEMTESGEDQRLGQGSSLRGSPSASTGAGLVLHQANHGLARDTQEDDDPFSTVMIHGAESASPAYRPSLSHVGEADERSDAEPWNGSTMQNSIEGDDEGIGLPEYSNAAPAVGLPTMHSTWNFESLPGKVGSDIANDDDDGGSNVAQNDNSPTNEFITENFDDMAMPSVENSEPESGYVESLDLVPSFQDDFQAPAADMNMGELAMQIWDQKQQKVHEVPADVGDQASDKVAEIHVSDEEPVGDKV